MKSAVAAQAGSWGLHDCASMASSSQVLSAQPNLRGLYNCASNPGKLLHMLSAQQSTSTTFLKLNDTFLGIEALELDDLCGRALLHGKHVSAQLITCEAKLTLETC